MGEKKFFDPELSEAFNIYIYIYRIKSYALITGCEIYVSYDCHNNQAFLHPKNISKLFIVMEPRCVFREAESEFTLYR